MTAKANEPPMSRRPTVDSASEVGDRRGTGTGTARAFSMMGIIAVDDDCGAEQSRNSRVGAVHFGPQ